MLGRRLALAAVPSRAVAANFERQGILTKKEGEEDKRGKKRTALESWEAFVSAHNNLISQILGNHEASFICPHLRLRICHAESPRI